MQTFFWLYTFRDRSGDQPNSETIQRIGISSNISLPAWFIHVDSKIKNRSLSSLTPQVFFLVVQLACVASHLLTLTLVFLHVDSFAIFSSNVHCGMVSELEMHKN